MDLDIPVTVLNRIPQERVHTSTIAVHEKDTVTIDLLSNGHGSSAYTVLVEGPLSRVAEAPSRVTLDRDTTTMTLNIDPSGLLEEGMLVRGEVHLVDLNGARTVLTVTLTAEDEASGVDLLRQPEVSFGLCLMLIGLSLLWPRKSVKNAPEGPKAAESITIHDVKMDPWGRPLDVHDGAGPDDPGAHVEPLTIDR